VALSVRETVGLSFLDDLQRLVARVHVWPFDRWDIPAGRSAIAEVYPALWSRGFVKEDRTDDQHDAFSIAAWLSRADRNGDLAKVLHPDLLPTDKAVAEVEGWILGSDWATAN
jgi:hypothetical protein